MDRFASIRPYNDDEVSQVLPRVLADPELVAAMTRFRFGWLPAVIAGLLAPWVRRALRSELSGVSDVASLQEVIEAYMSRMIGRTTAGFSASGLEALDARQPCLYVGNHRDITLDPAFTNYALYHSRRDTVRIAIGDNLLTKPYVADLMRLNKSFVVNRSASAPREVLKAYRELSAYIRHSIVRDRAPVWIAQREGRAKDGVDRTEPAIIKMLAMSKDRGMALGEYLGALRVVPVAISYELDPCDARKAAELHELAATGSYRKGEHEDLASITAGIRGHKGCVHVAFGEPLGGGCDTPEAAAAALDRQIIARYRLHATNLYAYRMLHGAAAPLPGAHFASGSVGERDFAARIGALPPAHRDHALAIYANAVVSKLELESGAFGG